MSFKEFLNVYEFQIVLPGSGEILKIKPITTGELKKLLIYENEEDDRKIEKALDELISSSVKDKDFNIEDLYLQDRFFLLVEIRKKTKGSSYKFTYECNKCKSQTLQNINLDSLKLKELKGSIPKNVKLTDNISVDLKHITRKEQIDAFENINDKGMTPLQRSTEIALYTYAAGIESIITPNGKEENVKIEDKKFLLENISTGSYDHIKNWHDDNNFGLDFTFNIKCNNCNNEEKIDIPLTNFFF